MHATDEHLEKYQCSMLSYSYMLISYANGTQCQRNIIIPGQIKNWEITLEQSFTVRIPLLRAKSAFGLGRRCKSDWNSADHCARLEVNSVKKKFGFWACTIYLLFISKMIFRSE